MKNFQLQNIREILLKIDRTKYEVDYLVEYFSQLKFFQTFTEGNQLTQQTLKKLFSQITCLCYQKNALVYREEDKSNNEMYVVIGGEIGLLKMDNDHQFDADKQKYLGVNERWKNYGNLEKHLGPGKGFGEEALMNHKTLRYYTAITLQPATLVVISKDLLKAIKDDSTIEIIKPDKPTFPQTTLQFIYNNPLVMHSNRLLYQNQDIVMRQGEQSRVIYLLLEGQCKILKHVYYTNENGKVQTNIYKFSEFRLKVGTLGPGEMFGLEVFYDSSVFEQITEYVRNFIEFNTVTSMSSIEKWISQNTNLTKTQLKAQAGSHNTCQFDLQSVHDQSQFLLIEVRNWLQCFNPSQIKDYLDRFLKKVLMRTMNAEIYLYKRRQIRLSVDEISMLKQIKQTFKRMIEREYGNHLNKATQQSSTLHKQHETQIPIEAQELIITQEKQKSIFETFKSRLKPTCITSHNGPTFNKQELEY